MERLCANCGRERERERDREMRREKEKKKKKEIARIKSFMEKEYREKVCLITKEKYRGRREGDQKKIQC